MKCFLFERHQMSDGVAVALRPALCEDVGRKIQHIVYENAVKERNLKFREIHTEFLKKLAKCIGSKIDTISIELDEMEELRYDFPESFCPTRLEECCRYSQLLDEKQWGWSYILDDIFYNSGKVVNSKYRPDPTIM